MLIADNHSEIHKFTSALFSVGTPVALPDCDKSNPPGPTEN